MSKFLTSFRPFCAFTPPRLSACIALFTLVLFSGLAEARLQDLLFSSTQARITVYKPGTREIESIIEIKKPVKGRPSEAVLRSRSGFLSDDLKERFNGTIDEIWLPSTDVEIKGTIPRSIRLRNDDPHNKTLAFSAHWKIHAVFKGVLDTVAVPFGVMNIIDDLRVTYAGETIELAAVMEGKRYQFDRRVSEQGLFLKSVTPLESTPPSDPAPPRVSEPVATATESEKSPEFSPSVEERRRLQDLDLKLTVLRYIHELDGEDEQRIARSPRAPVKLATGEVRDTRFVYDEIEWKGHQALAIRDTHQSGEIVKIIKLYGPNYSIQHLSSGTTLITQPAIGKRMIFSRPSWRYHFSQDLPAARCDALFSRK